MSKLKFPEHKLRYRNNNVASSIGLSGLNDAEWLEHFAAFEPLSDNLKKPLALKYHGHQSTLQSADR